VLSYIISPYGIYKERTPHINKVLEHHIRLHMLGHEKSTIPSVALAEGLIGIIHAYLSSRTF